MRHDDRYMAGTFKETENIGDCLENETDRQTWGGGGGGEQGHFLNLNYDGYNYAVEIEEKGHKY